MADGPDLPPEIEERIEAALEVLKGREDGHLPLPLRRRVRANFGDMGEGGAGRRGLFDLYRRCVERVLAVWRSERPHDERPMRMIELGQEVVTGRIDEDATRAEYDRFQVDLDNIPSEALGLRAGAVGLAAAALRVPAVAGDYADDYAPDKDDEDLDPDEWSPDYYASMAEASSFGAEDEDVEARRRYWRWYLEQAVPAAYRSVEE